MQFEIIHGELVRCTGKQKNGEEIIPSGISIIGTNAIYWYRNIRNIELPEEIKAIGAFAFQGCFELKNVKLPKNMSTIGNGAFRYCRNLQRIVLPDGIKTIEEEAFFKCEKLEEIILPSTLTEIKKGAFTGCKNLQRIVLPDGIKVIEENTFFGCENLEEIMLPSTLEEIKTWSFHNCTKLTSIKFPDNLNTIAAEAFTDCQSLRNLVLPEGISCIGENAFYGCNQLSLEPAPKTKLLSAKSYSLSYIQKWQKEKTGVILRESNDFHHPRRISCALPESTADKIFVFHVKWGKEKPRIGGKNTLTVYYPFFCLIGDSFYLRYGPDEYIKAKLLNVIKKEDDKAVIKIEVIDKKKIYSTVKRLSEKEKEKLRQASTLYDYNRPNYYEQISDQVFLFWDDCQGDYYFSDSFYTDEDGIDHLVERYSDNISVIEDRVIGFHEYCPIDRNSGFLLGEILKNNNQEAVARSSNLQAYGKYQYGIYYNPVSQYILYNNPPWLDQQNKTYKETTAEQNTTETENDNHFENEAVARRLPPWKADHIKKKR